MLRDSPMRDMATKHNGHIVRNKEHKMKATHTKQTPASMAELTPPTEAGTPQSSTPQTGVPNIAAPSKDVGAWIAQL
jgi:hypothetical protein